MDIDYRPELCENVVIAKIENDTKYVVHQVSHDIRLRVNAHTQYLLKLIDGERTVSELTLLMRNHFNQNISQHEIDLFIKNTLEPSGILRTDREVMKKEPAAYLNFRATIIPHSVVSKITLYLQFLFFNKIWYFIGLLLLGLGILYTSTISFRGISNFVTPAHILSYIPLSVCSYLAHELGHASACEKFGVKAGSIGFGFYLLMPVFYADVSNAWRLSTRKRIIINIAGMYFQLLISSILVLIYAITANEWMLYASLVNLLSTLPNLNPFVRYDGYWILSDLLGMNNIMEKAKQSYKQTLGWFLGKMKGRFPISTPTDKFLIGYFLINKMMVVVLLLVFVIFNGSSVYYFPGKVLNFISSLFTKAEARSFGFIWRFIVDNLASILFYIFLFRFIKGILVKKSRAGSK